MCRIILLRVGKYVVAVLTLGNLLVAGAAMGFPCKEPAIFGETPEEVAMKCGEPMLKEKRVVTVKETERKVTRSTVTNIEEWFFTAGPTELMQSYRFEDGKLVDIGSPGYGPVQDFSMDNCRNGELLAVWDSSLDAYMRCGEPLGKEKRADKVTESVEGDIKRQTAVSVVEWTYRYGPDLPGYTLRFENGLVTDIRKREYGK
jgi:Protein of unknown function (DUF2845)